MKWTNTMDCTDDQISETKNVLLETSKRLLIQSLNKIKYKLKEIEIEKEIKYFRLQSELGEREMKITNEYMSNYCKKWNIRYNHNKRKKVEQLQNKTNKENLETEEKKYELQKRISQQYEQEQRRTKITQMKGDGNCYFRALSQAFQENQEYHKEIRNKIIEEIKSNKTRYIAYIDNYEEHIYNMQFTDGRKQSWATEAEILATTNVFKSDVHVLVRQKEKDEYHNFNYEGNDKITSITLEYRNNHFNYIEKSLYGETPKESRKIVKLSEKDSNTPNKRDEDKVTEKMKSNPRNVRKSSKQNQKTKFKENFNIQTENRFEILNNLELETKPNAKDENFLSEIEENKKEKYENQKKIKNEAKHSIINKSKKILNQNHISILSKGLTFITDKDKEDISQIITDIENWGRRLKLAIHFGNENKDKDTSTTEKWMKKQPSKKWTPKMEESINQYNYR